VYFYHSIYIYYIEKFEKFYKSKKGLIKANLHQLEISAPLFYSKFVENHPDLERHVEYNIEDVSECLSSIFDKKDKKSYQEELRYDDVDFAEEMKELHEIAKELMDNNVRGWEQDW